MYFGAIEGNWDYALYTGEKIAWALENGFERCPKRRASGEAIFLKTAYPQVLEAWGWDAGPLRRGMETGPNFQAGPPADACRAPTT
jgi:hypothetical protein